MLAPARADAPAPARIDRAPRVGTVPVEAWILVALTVLGAALRFSTIATQSYWFDEAQAAHEMQLSFAALVHSLVTHETNPPVYFVFGWLWVRVFGAGEAALRSLSALAGVAVIPIAYLCGRELVTRRAGLVTAALVAVSPFMIWYSQEAREYMLLAALCGASLVFFARALRDPTTRNLGWWAAFSTLAVLTHFFAGFAVVPEAAWLLYTVRSRASVLAAAVVCLAQLSLAPLLFTHATKSLLGFITATPLSMRIQQVPVAFALGTLDQSSAVSYGLLGAAALLGALIFQLVVGAGKRELRGAGIGAALAACVLLIPLALALLGKDYYIPRALMPAWVPLAVVLGAACTVDRGRVAGVALGVVMLAVFVYGQVRIESSPQYQRPNWRGVARALGAPRAARAIVAYDGLAADPLAFYLKGVSWTQSPSAPVTISELDVVASSGQLSAARQPAGVALIATRVVDDYLVRRFSLRPAWRVSPASIGPRMQALLGPTPPAPAVLIQAPRPRP